MTLAPDTSSQDLASRLGANAVRSEVMSASQLSPSLWALCLRGSAALLAGQPGNDVMVSLEGDNRPLRRRYSVRSVDDTNDTLTLWMSTGHQGPGATFVQQCSPGEHIDLIGPRGKILLDPMADWHLFVGDTCSLGAFYRMAESIEPPGRAIFIVEVNEPDDAVTNAFPEGLGITGIFVNRDGRAPGDPTGILRGLAAFAFPPDTGHAYLFGEFNCMNVARLTLLDRGLSAEEISLKAFWRAGTANQDHGEPPKD
jgi:NADPH-dependent ferric siderophore reductase